MKLSQNKVLVTCVLLRIQSSLIMLQMKFIFQKYVTEYFLEGFCVQCTIVTFCLYAMFSSYAMGTTSWHRFSIENSKGKK